MDEKIKFIATYLEGSHSFVSLCRAFQISRKTGYKWIHRYSEFGHEGLSDRSRAPKCSPHETSMEVQKLLIEERKKHPNWGPKKILAFLESRNSGLILPCPSTVSGIYKTAGLTPKPPRKVRPIEHALPKFTSDEPNSVWCADYKGEFKTKDGKLCYPLTITDHHSRYILGCEGHRQNDHRLAIKSFESIFREYGLPKIILSDNATPFSSPSGFSRLSVWWIKLGILPMRIQPGKPQQNGRHERMHRTLKQETTRPPAADLPKQQVLFDQFVAEFNFERPHEALNFKTPAKIYETSPRKMPRKIEPPNYPSHMIQRELRIRGELNWKGEKYKISKALEYELVGMEEIDNGLWLIHFGPLKVGFLNERTKSVERTMKKAVKVLPMSLD